MYIQPDFSETVISNEEPTPSGCPHDGEHDVDYGTAAEIPIKLKGGKPGFQRTVIITCQACGKRGVLVQFSDTDNKCLQSIAVYLTEKEFDTMAFAAGLVFKDILGV